MHQNKVKSVGGFQAGATGGPKTPNSSFHFLLKVQGSIHQNLLYILVISFLGKKKSQHDTQA
jgi:hypothetical protein